MFIFYNHMPHIPGYITVNIATSLWLTLVGFREVTRRTDRKRLDGWDVMGWGGIGSNWVG